MVLKKEYYKKYNYKICWKILKFVFDSSLTGIVIGGVKLDRCEAGRWNWFVVEQR